MSIIDTLVYDRTQEDVARVDQLAERINAKIASDEEIAEWETDSKGKYNASDLNRVGAACEYLYNEMTRLAFSVSGYSALRTDWTEEEVPTPEQMATYLSTIAALKAVWDTAQEIPSTMDGLTVEGANNIEKLIADVDDYMHRLVYSMHRSAEFSAYSGEQFVPTANMDLGRTWGELDAMETTWANWQAATWYLLLYGNLEAEEDVT